MLTSKSNWNSFRDYKDQKAPKEMLQTIYKNMVLEDFINFGKDMSKGFSNQLSELLAAKVNVGENTVVAILNDLSFELYDELTDMGIKPENIYMVFGTWEKGGKPSMRRPVYEIMVDSAKANFVEFATDLTHFITTEEFMNMGIHFDYIIANPPYAIGNQITKAVIDNVEFGEYVNLMPLSCYKGKELYKHVDQLELADPKEFDDAAITDNLCVCNLNKNETEQSYEDLAIVSYAPEYREFYKLNAKCKKTYEVKGGFAQDWIADLINDDCAVFYGPYKSSSGFNDSDNIDANYNLRGNKSAVIKQYEKNKGLEKPQNGSGLSFIQLSSVAAKNNLIKYLFKDILSNNLLKGLNKSNGRIAAAIPNIDWSKDGDYEHLTLDDIMQILKDENPDII